MPQWPQSPNLTHLLQNGGTVSIQTHSKINLSLHVSSPRTDGYHNIRSVFQSIDFSDQIALTLRPGKASITIHCTDQDIPPESNILFHAWQHLQPQCQVEVQLTKNVPTGAGLGGGSANAAGFLAGLNALMPQPKSKSALAQIAKKLGADVPFFLTGGRALVQGIGEKITPLSPNASTAYVLILPGIHLSTPLIFKHYDQWLATHQMVRSLKGPLADLISGKDRENQLFPIVRTISSDIDSMAKRIVDITGLPVYMSGSGSSLFVETPLANAQPLKTQLNATLPQCRIEVAKPTPAGYQITTHG